VAFRQLFRRCGTHREPSLTFEGALRILGRHESKLIDRLDTLLGGVILAAGAGAGIAAVGPPAVAPLGMFAAVWGWLEQKDAALGLLRQAISAVSGRLVGTHGRERRELVAAAHTVIVVAAFFEVFHERVEEHLNYRLEITEEDKENLISRKRREDSETLYDRLYSAEVPAPSAAYGFMENISPLANWIENFSDSFDYFLNGLLGPGNIIINWKPIIDGTIERYWSHFIELAAKVPEFMIWALLNEGAATRFTVAGLRAEFVAALEADRHALGRVEALLSLDAGQGGITLDLRQAVAWANSGILEEKIVPEDAQGYGVIQFPTVGGSYINPRYRFAIARQSQYETPGVQESPNAKDAWIMQDLRPADEHWWAKQLSRNDFDLMMAGYMTSPDATRLPMLLLGHPGAGKSMVTKVLAARLPTSAYTVVVVPLRRVGANAPIVNQIETALSDATNGRVDSWWRLAEQSADTIRVVLLDGLDELLQASQANRSAYLQEVVEFQRREAEQNRPVVVVVTSRTVVADRVEIPLRSAVVKLDFFQDEDIENWLDCWHRINAAAISAKKMNTLMVKAVTSGTADGEPDNREQGRNEGGLRELARQPLLLLMLALYVADPTLPPLDPDLATADLYQRLIESFSRREVIKELGLNPHPDELNERVQNHLDRLAIAALAMFNRGRQDISEEELGSDLGALDPNLMEKSRPAEAGQRIIGKFFFVHAPEARTRIGLAKPHIVPDGQSTAEQSARWEPPRRSYEFLHATFGEHLVANHVMGELIEVAARAFAGRRGTAEPDDDLLYALLSHQALVARKSTLTFAREIFGGLREQDCAHVLEVLELLIARYRHRHSSNRYAGYQPVPKDMVRELACYSANLVALRVMLEPDNRGVTLTSLLRMADTALDQWRSMVILWKAGLDADALQSMLVTIEFARDSLGVVASSENGRSGRDGNRRLPIEDISLARLIRDSPLEKRLRYGAAIVDNFTYSFDESWVDEMASWLIPATAGIQTASLGIEPPEETSDEDIALVAGLILRYLRSATANASDEAIEQFIRLIIKLLPEHKIDSLTIAAVVASHPNLVDEIPELRKSSIYGQYAPAVRGLAQGIDIESTNDEFAIQARAILRNLIDLGVQWKFS
jgi:hypothetical protein